MVRCACGLKAVIRTSWTNQNPVCYFYGCPTLSPTCVNFIRWFDPPMCQRSVQIIPWLLRSHYELEEILAMVEEKRLRLRVVAFLGRFWVDVLSRQAARSIARLFRHEDAEGSATSTEINNLTRRLVDSIYERRSFIQELERFLGNVMAYKTREELKGMQKDDLIKAMKMRTIAL
ncbi:hypothetical protein Tco_0412709 [Tanacetum coccineum]